MKLYKYLQLKHHKEIENENKNHFKNQKMTKLI